MQMKAEQWVWMKLSFAGSLPAVEIASSCFVNRLVFNIRMLAIVGVSFCCNTPPDTMLLSACLRAEIDYKMLFPWRKPEHWHSVWQQCEWGLWNDMIAQGGRQTNTVQVWQVAVQHHLFEKENSVESLNHRGNDGMHSAWWTPVNIALNYGFSSTASFSYVSCITHNFLH